MNTLDKEDVLTLKILQKIEHKNNMTQRNLADSMGVALGLANSYLKRCVRKGFIKIQQIPANRYLYYLTPQGFAEKSRLTAEYLTYSFDFYRKASDSINRSLSRCKDSGYRGIIFCGVSELAEIASIRIHEYELEHLVTLDEKTYLKCYLGKPVTHELHDSAKEGALLITSLSHSEAIYTEMIRKFSKEKVLVPDILGLNI